jgi:hypothetical protein
MDDQKGISGFKKSEFANATPDRVFGEDVRIEELPDGIRLYLKEKSVNLQTKKLAINVYKVIDDGGLKNKRVWVGKMINKKPEEDEIAEQFGGGCFLWIGKWLSADGQERGIISEIIEIDEDFGRAAHEKWMRKNGPAVEPIPAAAAAVPVSGFAGDAMALLKIMDAAEEKTLARMERMAAIIGGQKQQTPGDVLESAYGKASDMMARAVETNFQMAKSVNKSNAKALENPEPAAAGDGGEDAETLAGPALPPWLAPFMPHIEKGIGKLLEGGPMGAAVKTLILSSEEWQGIFQDKEKWGLAVAAMENHFGTEQTRKALDILLNKRNNQTAKKGRK